MLHRNSASLFCKALKVHFTEDLPSLPSVATLSTPIQAQQTPELFIITCGPSGVFSTDTSSICSPLCQECHFWPSFELSEGFCELLFLYSALAAVLLSVCLPRPILRTDLAETLGFPHLENVVLHDAKDKTLNQST